MLNKIGPAAFKPQTLLPAQQRQNAARPETEEAPQNSLQALRKKQLEDMQKSLSALQTLKQQLSPKKQAAERAARLKQRLEMLRDMLAKLPPGDHKALARELKQIAKELAALGKNLGGQGASATPALTFHAGAASGDAEAGTAGAAEGNADAAALAAAASAAADGAETGGGSAEAERLAGEAAASAHAAADEKTADEPNGPPGDARDDRSGSKIGSPAANGDTQDDKALRALLKDAKKLLKHVADLLKAKTIKPDKESKKIFEDIDRSLRKLDESLRGGENPLYSALGELTLGSADGGEAAGSGQTVNVSV